MATTGSSFQPTARNPISLRLWKVIGSTSFDDPSSREALQTVSDYYTHHETHSAVPDARRRKRYQLQADQGQAAASARRNLKRDLETQLSEGSARFLEAFGEVDKVSRNRLQVSL
jgi:hypothetical protein